MTDKEKARVFVYTRGDGKWIAIEVVSQACIAIERSETLARDCAIAIVEDCIKRI